MPRTKSDLTVKELRALAKAAYAGGKGNQAFKGYSKMRKPALEDALGISKDGRTGSATTKKSKTAKPSLTAKRYESAKQSHAIAYALKKKLGLDDKSTGEIHKQLRDGIKKAVDKLRRSKPDASDTQVRAIALGAVRSTISKLKAGQKLSLSSASKPKNTQSQSSTPKSKKKSKDSSTSKQKQKPPTITDTPKEKPFKSAEVKPEIKQASISLKKITDKPHSRDSESKKEKSSSGVPDIIIGKDGAHKQFALKVRYDGTHHDVPDLDDADEENFREVANSVVKITGMTARQALDSVKAISDFTDRDYNKIRAVERGDTEPDEKTIKQIQAINMYLTQAPKFKGEIHRGMNFNDKQSAQNFLANLESGKSIHAMSSFSSNLKIAEEFSNFNDEDDEKDQVKMILHVKNNSRGVSVRPFSIKQEENEVIVPKGTKYRITHTEWKDAVNKENSLINKKLIHVHLEEI